METTLSADGTEIAYDRTGSGDPVILVPPAFGLRGIFTELAAELADSYAVISYDRRGRGDSTDAIAPTDVGSYSIDREVEDLAAVNDAAGGDAALVGYSSGGMLALATAAAGVPIGRIALYEPPFRRGGAAHPELVARLIELVTAGRAGDAVATFQLEGIGLPPEVVEQIRRSPAWAALEAIGQTVVYDATLTSDPEPSAAARALQQPIAVLAGAQTWPHLVDGCRLAAELIPTARFFEVPGGANHAISPAATAAVLREFLG